jgi:4'-phosphopantetheinyl transferase
MPLFRKSRISSSVSLGIWKIEEDPEKLRANVELSVEENKYYESLRSESRRRHWLSYRNILIHLLDKDSRELFYDDFGKPHPVNKSCHLSVTHSGKFSAAIVSTEAAVGIDIEMLKDRVERVKERFLSKEEIEQIGMRNRLEKLYICWGAKESLFKLHGKPELEFCRDILVAPFEYDMEGCGECTVNLTTPGERRNLTVHYERIEDYMLVYSYDINKREDKG